MQDKEVTRAGFGPRAAAYIIDRAIILAGLLAVRTPFRLAALLGASQLTAKDFIFRYSFLDVLSWALGAAYLVLLTYFTGGTLGKKVLRLRVEKEDGEPLRLIDALYRETVGRFLSGIACIGYLMTLVDKKKRAFHDWLCDTRVVYDQVTFRAREKEAAPAPGWTPKTEAPAAETPAAESLVWSLPAQTNAAPDAVPAAMPEGETNPMPAVETEKKEE